MIMHENIETFGELEVLEFLEDMQDDSPPAINIPFIYFTERDKWMKEKKEALALFGVKGVKAPYDFSEAKSILFFCNGVWCRQSPQMIEALLELGYPAKNMKWYRGGMQSWLSVGMTSTRTAQ